jgi:hypothetical protein
VLAQQEGPANRVAGDGFGFGGRGAAVAFIQRIERDGGEAGAAAVLADIDRSSAGAVDGCARVGAEGPSGASK